MCDSANNIRTGISKLMTVACSEGDNAATPSTRSLHFTPLPGGSSIGASTSGSLTGWLVDGLGAKAVIRSSKTLAPRSLQTADQDVILSLSMLRASIVESQASSSIEVKSHQPSLISSVQSHQSTNKEAYRRRADSVLSDPGSVLPWSGYEDLLSAPSAGPIRSSRPTASATLSTTGWTSSGKKVAILNSLLGSPLQTAGSSDTRLQLQ